MRMFLGLGVLVLSLGCGSDSPPTPPSQTPQPAQIGGVWRGNGQATTVTGGECFAATYQAFVGVSRTFTLTVDQSGSTARGDLTGPASGISCSFSGTVRETDFTMSVTMCAKSDFLATPCPGSGPLRDIRLVRATVVGNISSNSMTGTATENFEINGVGMNSTLGTLAITNSFTLTKQ